MTEKKTKKKSNENTFPPPPPPIFLRIFQIVPHNPSPCRKIFFAFTSKEQQQNTKIALMVDKSAIPKKATKIQI